MDTVLITCYGTSKTMPRDEAIRFYTDGVLSCDGCEKARYAEILGQLVAGYAECSDGSDLKGATP